MRGATEVALPCRRLGVPQTGPARLAVHPKQHNIVTRRLPPCPVPHKLCRCSPPLAAATLPAGRASQYGTAMTSSLYSAGAATEDDEDQEVQHPKPPEQQHAEAPPAQPEPPRSPPQAAGLFVLKQPCPHSPVLGGAAGSPVVGGAAAPDAALRRPLLIASAGSVAAAHLPPRHEQRQGPRGSLLDQLLGVNEQGLQAPSPAASPPPSSQPRRRSASTLQQAAPETADGRPRLLFAAVQRPSLAVAASSDGAGQAQPGPQPAQQQPGPPPPSMLEMILGRRLQQEAPAPKELPAAAWDWGGTWCMPPPAEPAAEAVEKEEVELPAQAALAGRLVQWKQRRAPAVQQQVQPRQQQIVEQQPQQQHQQQQQQPQQQQRQQVEQAQPSRPAVQPRGLQGPPHKLQGPTLPQQPCAPQHPQQAQQAAQHMTGPRAHMEQRPVAEPAAACREQPLPALQASKQWLQAAAAAAAAAAAEEAAVADTTRGNSDAAAQPAANLAAAEEAAAAGAAAPPSQQVAAPPALDGAAAAAAGAAAVAEAYEASSLDAEMLASPATYDGPRDLESFLPAGLAAVFQE